MPQLATCFSEDSQKLIDTLIDLFNNNNSILIIPDCSTGLQAVLPFQLFFLFFERLLSRPEQGFQRPQKAHVLCHRIIQSCLISRGRNARRVCRSKASRKVLLVMAWHPNACKSLAREFSTGHPARGRHARVVFPNGKIITRRVTQSTPSTSMLQVLVCKQ
jgi:hypothetical protein